MLPIRPRSPECCLPLCIATNYTLATVLRTRDPFVSTVPFSTTSWLGVQSLATILEVEARNEGMFNRIDIPGEVL